MYSPSPSLFTRCVLFSGFYFHSYNFSFCIHFSLVYHDCVCFLVKYCYLNEYEEKRIHTVNNWVCASANTYARALICCFASCFCLICVKSFYWVFYMFILCSHITYLTGSIYSVRFDIEWSRTLAPVWVGVVVFVRKVLHLYYTNPTKHLIVYDFFSDQTVSWTQRHRDMWTRARPQVWIG